MMLCFAKRAFLVLACASLLTPAAGAAEAANDGVPDLIEQGRRAYADGDLAEALKAFQQVTAELEDRARARLDVFLPKPPEGWVVTSTVNQTSAVEGGAETERVIHIKRVYTRRSDGVEMLVLVSNERDRLRGLRETFAHLGDPTGHARANRNPDEEYRLEKRHGWPVAIRVTHAPHKFVNMSSANNDVAVIVQSAGADEGTVRRFFNAVDLRRLAAAVAAGAPAKSEEEPELEVVPQTGE